MQNKAVAFKAWLGEEGKVVVCDEDTDSWRNAMCGVVEWGLF